MPNDTDAREDTAEHVCGDDCDDESTHPFDLAEVSEDELIERESDRNIIDLADDVLALLVARGAGAEEAIFACVIAARYGAAWCEARGACEHLFDHIVAEAEDLEAVDDGGHTADEMAAMN